MKTITFASFKGGAGKTTAVMAVASALVAQNQRVALIDADENLPLIEWRDAAMTNKLWTNQCSVFEADDLPSFERAFSEFERKNLDYLLIDTRGGGSELNNACLINTDLVIIPTALTALDMTQALSTFEHAVELHRSINIELPIALLFQRVPVGKLTVSQRRSLETLSQLPRCETILHARDAYASMTRQGMLHRMHEEASADLMRKFNAAHIGMALSEAQSLAQDLLEALEDS